LAAPAFAVAALGAAPSHAAAFERLSDEWRRTTSAHVRDAVWAHERPAATAPRVKRLGRFTEHGSRETVVVLRGGGAWVQVRLPMRPARTGWVLRRGLGPYRTVRTALHIRRRSFRATLYRDGRAVWRARVGVGQPQWPTPAGRFYVRERMIPPDPGGIYGVYAFGTSAYSPTLTDWPGGGIVGIHGTNQPGLIPGRISHGCVRLRNRDIQRLRRLMPLGTPILIR
jgi:hypothetical protein